MTNQSETKETPRKKLINTNLISLKCLLFVFFGGLASLYPFLPLHMELIGLTKEEIQIVSMVAPVVAILGPLVACPIADRLAGRQESNGKSSTGRYLRVMIAIACIMSAILYVALLFIPPVNRVNLTDDRRPSVKFSCDHRGATIHQERCRESPHCHRWFNDEHVGEVLLENCAYVCNPMTSKRREKIPEENSLDVKGLDVPEFGDSQGSGDMAVRPLDEISVFEKINFQDRAESKKYRRYVMDNEPPHMCYNNGSQHICYVYTPFTGSLPIRGTLKQAINPDEKDEWCIYPVVERFSCRIPQSLRNTMFEFNQTCTVECELTDPYTVQGSVLAESQCQQVMGDPVLTFYSYLTIRSVADAFPTAAIALVDAAIVLATRETSCGRGDVGRQLSFGSLGYAAFGSLSGYLITILPKSPMYYVPFGLFAVLFLISACIALGANGMPLSPEWWWHTRSGLLALPMSSVKRYGSEIAALMLVFVVLGIFWSAMNTYLPLHLKDMYDNELLIGVAMTAGAVPAFFFLWKSEHLVDYCGHSNLLILAFTVYIVRFVAMSVLPDPWWALFSENLQLFTLGIMWVTAILYMRHLVPRHMSITAQALPVIAHFCIGRCIGAVVGAYVTLGDGEGVYSTSFMYSCMAAAAAVVAILYFILYHGLLKPRCHAQTIQGPRQPPTIVQAINGNGSYTPLRVYHNGKGRKGQFRY